MDFVKNEGLIDFHKLPDFDYIRFYLLVFIVVPVWARDPILQKDCKMGTR
jgi:hypothetical protein